MTTISLKEFEQRLSNVIDALAPTDAELYKDAIFNLVIVKRTGEWPRFRNDPEGAAREYFEGWNGQVFEEWEYDAAKHSFIESCRKAIILEGVTDEEDIDRIAHNCFFIFRGDNENVSTRKLSPKQSVRVYLVAMESF